MTTVVYHRKSKVMAADTQTTCGDTRDSHVRKVFRRPSDGALIGVAGSASLAQALARWFMAGEVGTRPELERGNFVAQAIIVRPGNRVEFHDQLGSHDMEGDFYVAGSGSDVALGALAMGASARKAVQVAMDYDTKTGGKVNWVKLA